MPLEPSSAESGRDGERANEPSRWTCKQCGEVIEGQFDSCWKCTGHAAVQESGEPGVLGETDGDSVPMACLRCSARMQYAGGKSFPEGVDELLGELFQHYEHFDMYFCSRCGRAEFFVRGIGKEFKSPRGDG
jgi:hypothetical protein